MPTKDELVEKCARIINPWAWGQFDTALAPYKENRGSAGSENFWHQNLWQAGCRSEADVISHWRYVEKDVLEGAIVSWRDSIEKARAALAIAMPAAFEMAAEVAEKRAEARFADFGTTEPDTNASYYSGRRGEALDELDEEDGDIAKALRELKEKWK